jgi:broad specificity phosphatase PhoE
VTVTFFLLRHAAHDNLGRYLAGRAPGVHLGPGGIAQAQQLARRMERETLGALFSSPRDRARETAAAIAAAHGDLDVETTAALEEVDFGEWAGSTFDELNERADWRHWNSQRSLAQTPAGETMLDVQHRAVGFVLTAAAQQGDGAVALVSHADVIRAIVGHVLGLPIDAWQRFDIAPASITTMVLGDWGARLLTLNETTA